MKQKSHTFPNIHKVTHGDVHQATQNSLNAYKNKSVLSLDLNGYLAFIHVIKNECRVIVLFTADMLLLCTDNIRVCKQMPPNSDQIK